MSKSDTAKTAAILLGAVGLATLAGVGAYYEAELESKLDPEDLAARRAARMLQDEYTFVGTRNTSDSTCYLFKVENKAGQFVTILVEPEQDLTVYESNVPGVKAGKQIRFDASRLTNDLESAVSRRQYYRAADRKVTFWGYADFDRLFKFEVLKKGEWVPMFIKDITSSNYTLSVL